MRRSLFGEQRDADYQLFLHQFIFLEESRDSYLAADHYVEAIGAHGDAPFDRTFMEKTFYDFWNKDMRFITEWNNKLLGGTPEYIVRVLTAANEIPEIRHRWVNGYYRNRADFFEWLGTPEKAEAYLEQIESSRLAAHT